MNTWPGASFALALGTLAASGGAQSRDSTRFAPIDSTSAVDDQLRTFLIETLERTDPYLDPTDSSVDAKARYATASIRLAPSGPPMQLVYLVGGTFCGTGGAPPSSSTARARSHGSSRSSG